MLNYACSCKRQGNEAMSQYIVDNESDDDMCLYTLLPVRVLALATPLGDTPQALALTKGLYELPQGGLLTSVYTFGVSNPKCESCRGGHNNQDRLLAEMLGFCSFTHDFDLQIYCLCCATSFVKCLQDLREVVKSDFVL
jgi:hypothetical protein